MNRIVLSFLPLAAVAYAAAQVPAPTNTVSETSRIARYVPGPGDRPQGALLRNGTFVTFSPALAQQLPASLSKNASVQVVGEGFSYEGSKAIQARTVTIAGVSYSDEAPSPGGPGWNGRPAPRPGPDAPPPPPPRPGVPPPPPPPGGPGAPPPPPLAGAPPAGVPGAPAGAPTAPVPPPPPPPDAAAPPPANSGAPAPATPEPAAPPANPSGL